jgi:hypothetical protein
MYFLLIQAQIFILFFIVYLIIYFCSLYELQISDQIFILVLTVAFMTIPQFDAKTIEDKWYDYWMKTIIFIQSQIIEPIYHSNSSQMLLEFYTWGIC